MVTTTIDAYRKRSHKFILPFIDPELLLKVFSCGSSALCLAEAACGSGFQVFSHGKALLMVLTSTLLKSLRVL